LCAWLHRSQYFSKPCEHKIKSNRPLPINFSHFFSFWKWGWAMLAMFYYLIIILLCRMYLTYFFNYPKRLNSVYVCFSNLVIHFLWGIEGHQMTLGKKTFLKQQGYDCCIGIKTLLICRTSTTLSQPFWTRIKPQYGLNLGMEI
jgi:hypothetical protein